MKRQQSKPTLANPTMNSPGWERICDDVATVGADWDRCLALVEGLVLNANSECRSALVGFVFRMANSNTDSMSVALPHHLVVRLQCKCLADPGRQTKIQRSRCPE